MDKCLLIGNGLNRCLKHSIAWGDLLKEIAENYDVNYNGAVPMPMEFERIVNQIFEKQKNPNPNLYLEVKSKIVDRLSQTKLPDNAIHNELTKLKINVIMTTNYDYLLEYVFNKDFSFKGGTNKYYFERTSVQQGIDFYHLHGMVASKQSLCLGYEHYAGNVQKLRGELNTKKENRASEMLIKKILFGEEERNNTWGERFYTSNIDIVGLGLTESEIDLWWLLMHRAYLYYSNYEGVKKYLKNIIVFHDILEIPSDFDDENDKKRKIAIQREKENRYKMLEKAHVIVKYYVMGQNETYSDVYRRILENIREGN